MKGQLNLADLACAPQESINIINTNPPSIAFNF